MAANESGLSAYHMNHEQQIAYRVWPDGTVQSSEDGAPYSWMSDDFMVLHAANEDEALSLANL